VSHRKIRFAGQLVAFAGVMLAEITTEVEALAEGHCTDTRGEIEVDRPDVTNSSVVVPEGSLQIENGVNLTQQGDARLVDGPNTRVRFGLGGCNEFLVDLPNYTYSLSRGSASGFSDISPAIKHQIGPLPGDIDLSATLGIALPTGNPAVSGSGYQAYLQFPWSHELGGGWEISGMVTAFWYPNDSTRRGLLQPTLVIEHQVMFYADLFVEYVGGYPTHGAPSQLLNSGGAYRFTRLQQLDFHLAFGLDERAPRYSFGIGYSIRWDR
jgi:Putative MetA-pathway of phenol degradation